MPRNATPKAKELEDKLRQLVQLTQLDIEDYASQRVTAEDRALLAGRPEWDELTAAETAYKEAKREAIREGVAKKPKAEPKKKVGNAFNNYLST